MKFSTFLGQLIKVCATLCHGILNRWNLHCTNCAKIPLNKWFEIHATLRNFIKRNFTTIGTVQIPMVETSMV